MESTPINPNGIGPGASLPSTGLRVGGTGGTGFKEMFERFLDEVNALQLEADKSVRDLAAGKADSLHQVIVAMSEADLSFRLMMQMRNKLIEAYKEIMRMQV